MSRIYIINFLAFVFETFENVCKQQDTGQSLYWPRFCIPKSNFQNLFLHVFSQHLWCPLLSNYSKILSFLVMKFHWVFPTYPWTHLDEYLSATLDRVYWYLHCRLDTSFKISCMNVHYNLCHKYCCGLHTLMLVNHNWLSYIQCVT